MAVKKVSFLIDVDTKTGEAQIRRFVDGIDKGTTSIKKMNAELKQTSKNMGQTIDKTGLAGAAVVEIGRTISDANFGMTAMANNLSQLSTLMVTLIATTGGLKNGMKALWAAFKGPLGLIVAFQIVVTLLEKMAIAEKSAASGANEVAKAYKNAATELEALVRLDKDLTDTQVENIKLRIVALKEEAKVRAQLTLIQKKQAEIIAIEQKKNEEFVSFLQKIKAGFQSGTINFKLNKSGPEQGILMGLLFGMGKEEKDKLIKEKEKEIEDIFNGMNLDALNDILSGKLGKGKKSGGKQKGLFAANQPATFMDFLVPTPEELGESLGIMANELDRHVAELSIITEFNKILEAEDKRHKDALRKADEAALEHKLLMYDAIGLGLHSLGFLLGESTQEGKAIAAAGALIDTYAAITKTLAVYGGTPWGIAQSIATGLMGFAQVKRIYEVNVPGQGGGGGGVGTQAAGVELPQPQEPDFNIIGSSGINQIGRAVRGQFDKPVRAYITSKDVRTGAELDRNIVDGSIVG